MKQIKYLPKKFGGGGGVISKLLLSGLPLGGRHEWHDKAAEFLFRLCENDGEENHKNYNRECRHCQTVICDNIDQWRPSGVRNIIGRRKLHSTWRTSQHTNISQKWKRNRGYDLLIYLFLGAGVFGSPVYSVAVNSKAVKAA